MDKTMYTVDNTEEVKGLEEKAEAYLKLKNEIKALEDKKKQYEAEFLKSLNQHKADKLQAGLYKISCSIIIRHNVDGKALKEAHPDIYTKFLNESIYSKFTVSV